MSDLARRAVSWSATNAPCAIGALVVGAIALGGTIWGASVALLGLAAATMLLAIGAFWSSIRMLVGESPLDPADAYSLGVEPGADDQKRALLRALEDLEQDHALGRVDDADYGLLRERYRSEAQALLGAPIADDERLRERVERRIAERRSTLDQGPPSGAEPPADARGEQGDDGEGPPQTEQEASPDRGGLRGAAPVEEPVVGTARRRAKRRPTCSRCGSPNDRDARFCKRCGKPLAVLLVLALLLVGSTAAGQAPLPTGAAEPELPPGHPDISQMAGGSGMSGSHAAMRPRRPANVLEDPLLPEGTIELVVIDADDRPVPRVPIELALRYRSSSGALQSERTEAATDEAGRAHFDDLPVGEGISYSLRAERGGGQFFVDPFDLPEGRGVRARLRAPETTERPSETGLETWAMVALEVRESVVLVEHVLRVTNAGPKAWLPTRLALELPEGALEVEADEAMGGGVVRVANGAVELDGTFPVGVTDLRYRYRLPLADAAEQTLAVGIAPAASWIRVVTPASAGIGLTVAGLGTAKPSRSPEGQRLLVAEQRVEPFAQAGVRRLTVTLTGLPTAGPARWVALAVSVLLLSFGAAVGWRRRRERGASAVSLREAREVLLDEVAALEHAAAEGRVDPPRFESTRRGLVDALVRIEQRLDADSR